ncbi:type IV pilin protein [Rugamonas sp.]|uniref:type IV pilin protein n=1 Tax=Rugamonas sp. TaxID=1926287 RepID=UPI0025F95C06|nr:type IV pilin protein [Rugamonas sp.]
MSHRGSGFSAIELMTLLVVAALLAAAAVPAFSRYVVRVRRGEAEALLEQLMQQQERYYELNNSYLAFSAASSDPAARQFKWWSGASAPVSAYEIVGKACDGELIAQCIQLQATPGTGNVDPRFREPDCQMLTLTSSG